MVFTWGRLFWSRVAFSNFTLSFFVLALAHCLVQIALEVYAYHLNRHALHLLETIYDMGNGSAVASGFAVWENQRLSICQGVPSDGSCTVVWNATDAFLRISAANTAAPSPTQTGDNASLQAAIQPLTAAPESSAPAVPAVGQNAIIPAPVVTNAAGAVSPLPSTFAVSPARGGIAANDDDDDEVEDDDDDEDLTVAVTRTAATPGPTGVLGLVPDVVGNALDGVLSKRNEPEITRKLDGLGRLVGVSITDPSLKGGEALASPACIATLKIPIQDLRNTERVDLTFVAFQIWVLGMSIVALLNESIPHLIASLFTHGLATAYSGYQIAMTQDFRKVFNRLIVQGPCASNLIPDYWQMRRSTEIAILSLNAVMFVLMAALSYKLVKSFGWQTFKRIGASLKINRIYRLVLAFSISVQLSVFFVGANVVLWIDQLYNGNVAKYGQHLMLYKAVYFTVLVVLGPWLAAGWFAVRREHRMMMLGFIITAIAMTGGWAIMFASRSFLWTFKSWDFFAAMTVVAAVLLIATLGLGITCRLNFDKGLPRYLNAQPASSEAPADEIKDPNMYDEEEKFDFPSSGPVPTFSVAFRSGLAPPPAEMNLGPAPTRPAPGISMHARSTEDEPDVDMGYLGARLAARESGAPPAPRRNRESLASNGSYSSDAGLRAHAAAPGARGVERSDSTSSGASGSSKGSRRWIIE